MFQLEDCIAYLTCMGSKTLSQRLEKRLELWHVTRIQWIAMYYIGQNEQITQNQLAEKMSLKEPTIVRLIDRMEKEEMIHRISTSLDRRKKYLELTPKGKQLNDELTQVGQKFKDDAIADLSEEELATFLHVLAKMIDNTKI